MADRLAENVTSAGIEPTAHPASGGGDTVPPDTVVRVMNGGESPITLTIVTPGTVDGLDIADRTVTVPAGEVRLVRPTRAAYMNPATGKVNLTWSSATNVSFEVIR